MQIRSVLCRACLQAEAGEIYFAPSRGLCLYINCVSAAKSDLKIALQPECKTYLCALCAHPLCVCGSGIFNHSRMMAMPKALKVICILPRNNVQDKQRLRSITKLNFLCDTHRQKIRSFFTHLALYQILPLFI